MNTSIVNGHEFVDPWSSNGPFGCFHCKGVFSQDEARSKVPIARCPASPYAGYASRPMNTAGMYSFSPAAGAWSSGVPCSSCDAMPWATHADGCPNAPAAPAPEPKSNACPDCDRELCWMDTYYGKDEFLAARCQPCREKRGERRSA